MKQIILFLLVSSVNAISQVSIDSVLADIERNNNTLSAFRQNVDADKIGNKTGIFPANPEIEFIYLWGDPSDIGNRTDFSVSQSFDFPTAYVYLNRISKLKNQQAELEYQKQRIELLHQTRLLCVNLTYQNALLAEYNKRVNYAEQIAIAYRKKLEVGEASVLVFNKAHIYMLNLSKKLETVEIERKSLLAELARLNGGVAIMFTDSVFAMPQLMLEFEQWYAQAEQNNSALQMLKQEVVISHKQKQLEVAQNLPGFSAGYMSEKVVGEQFKGISVGFTIPLWENKNTIKYAKAKALAVEKYNVDAKLQFYNRMKTQYDKVFALKNSISNYREMLRKYNNRELLAKALDKGEISISEYYVELTLYYESIDKLLEMERSMNEAYSELIKY